MTTRIEETKRIEQHGARVVRGRGWLAWAAATLLALGAALGATDASAQARAGAGSRAGAQAQTAPAATGAGVVDVNSATEEQLMLLPGIGPAKARAILALRQRIGRFRRPEDLLRVRGIGRATLRRLRSMIATQGGTTLAARPAGRRVAAAAQEGGE